MSGWAKEDLLEKRAVTVLTANLERGERGKGRTRIGKLWAITAGVVKASNTNLEEHSKADKENLLKKCATTKLNSEVVRKNGGEEGGKVSALGPRGLHQAWNPV